MGVSSMCHRASWGHATLNYEDEADQIIDNERNLLQVWGQTVDHAEADYYSRILIPNRLPYDLFASDRSYLAGLVNY